MTVSREILFLLYLDQVKVSLLSMLHRIVQSKLHEIETLCQVHGVLRLDAFGSVIRDDFNEDSDLDFLVTFSRGDGVNAFNQYFEFKEALEALLGRKVDLVSAKAIRNRYLKQEVEQAREPLYAA